MLSHRRLSAPLLTHSCCSNNWTVFAWKLMEKAIILKKTEQYSEYQEWLCLLPKMPSHYNHIP